MTSNLTDNTDAENLNRRRLLQGIAATGAVTTAAGCLGDDDDADDTADDTGDDSAGGTDDDADDDPTGVDDDDDEPTDTTEIQEGGRLEFAVERPNIDDYDMADSTLADDSTVFNAVYDGLRAANPEGEYFNWMVEEYEVTEAQDVAFPDDYTEYMGEYEIVNAEGDLPAIDVEWPNIVFPGAFHPEDLSAYAEGELGEGDSIRALTREEAGDAAEDGVYGVQIEGRLHEGIEFHNGDSCTAGDVVGSYDRMAGSANQGQQFSDFLHAEAPDGDDGLDFVLYGQEADAIAEVELPPFWVFPEAHHDIQPGDLDPRDGGEVPIGTGPYEIAEFSEGSQLLLERTDNYWMEEVGLENKEWWDGDDDFPARPPIEEINVRFVPEDGTRVASLQDGEIDLAYQLPAGDRTAFDQDENFEVAAAISTGFKFMQFPISDESAFQHREVRDAVSHLIPRRDIVEIVAEGWGAPARAPIPEPAAGLGTNMSYDEFENADFSFPENPDVETAEALIDESPLDPPIEMVIRTNADDSERQDKMQIAVDELNASGLFEATLETPADIGDWVSQDLYVEDATDNYGADNAVAVIGLAAGFDPDGYNRAIHHPDNYNICCNFFHPDGTFDWIDDYDATRFGPDVAEDADLRRDRFDEIWPQLTHDLGNTLVDYSLETAVAGPRLNGYAGYPDRRAFLSYGLYAPYDGVAAWLGDE